MVKDLEADPFVSERFQFLTFGYSTGDPIPYSACTLRRAILDERDRLDPDRSNPAWDRMVLIGHSMGGLLCRMMTQDSGSNRVSSGIRSSPSGTALSARVGATARCRMPVHTTRAQSPS